MGTPSGEFGFAFTQYLRQPVVCPGAKLGNPSFERAIIILPGNVAETPLAQNPVVCCFDLMGDPGFNGYGDPLPLPQGSVK